MTTYNETQVLSYEQVLDELRAIVAEKGYDYVYPTVDVTYDDDEGYVAAGQCVYFDPGTGQPSCVVGHWFALHNVVLDDEYDGLYNHLNMETSIRDILENHYWVLPFTVDYHAQVLLTMIQGAQDTGMAWGAALERATNFVKCLTGVDGPVDDPWELPS